MRILHYESVDSSKINLQIKCNYKKNPKIIFMQLYKLILNSFEGTELYK